MRPIESSKFRLLEFSGLWFLEASSFSCLESFVPLGSGFWNPRNSGPSNCRDSGFSTSRACCFLKSPIYGVSKARVSRFRILGFLIARNRRRLGSRSLGLLVSRVLGLLAARILLPLVSRILELFVSRILELLAPGVLRVSESRIDKPPASLSRVSDVSNKCCSPQSGPRRLGRALFFLSLTC